MKFRWLHRVVLLLGLLVVSPAAAQTAATTPAAADSFYTKSLHFTARGLVYNYERGLQRLTGFPADRLGCTKSSCHVKSCDTCHKVEADGKAAFSTAHARSGKPCQACHGAPNPKDTDVHVRLGMGCMDCHTSRDIHGDGTPYDSAWQKGAVDVRCERCHKDVTQSASHTAHKGRVDCSACHTRETPTCFNCHIDSRLAGEKETSIRRDGLTFLVNHDDRVKLGNVLTYVYRNGTAITVAPTFPHKITAQGRTCAECHATQIVKDVSAGALVLTRFENGDLTTVKGVVPVADGMAWRLAFLGREKGKWVPLTNPKPPIVSFSGFASPLTKQQLASLVKEAQ